MRVGPGDEVLHGTEGALTLIPYVALDKPARLEEVDGEDLVCAAPLTGKEVGLGRRGGPEFLESELARLGHLAGLAASHRRPRLTRSRRSISRTDAARTLQTADESGSSGSDVPEPLGQPGGTGGAAGDSGADGGLGADDAHVLLGPGDGGVEQLAGEQPRAPPPAAAR